MYSLGIDAGSRYTKFALLHDGAVVRLSMVPSDWTTRELTEKMCSEFMQKHGISRSELFITATGYGRVSVDADAAVTEITCHALGVHYLSPAVRTVIDIGGQDSKIIICEENGAVADFIMNDKCAAGTGKFLEMMLETLGGDVCNTGCRGHRGGSGPDYEYLRSLCRVRGHLSAVVRGKPCRYSCRCHRLRCRKGRKSCGTRTGCRRCLSLRRSVRHQQCGLYCPGRTAESGPVVTSPDAQFAGAIGAALKGFRDRVLLFKKEKN